MKKPKQFSTNKSKSKSFSLYDTGSMYDQRWRRYRFRFLKKNPNCYVCGNTASVVDHLVPHRNSRELFEKTDNHIPLCQYCHNTITALFDRHIDKDQDEMLKKKLEWIASHRITTFAVKVLPYYDKEPQGESFPTRF